MPRVVRADVVDLTADQPKLGDTFLVDTNVWYWLTYTPASQTAKPYQVKHYPAFIQRALTVKASLRFVPETFAELAHIIEVAEHKTHKALGGVHQLVKDFRHDPVHRATVTKEISLACAQLPTLAECLSSTRDQPAVNDALRELVAHQVDGYDAFVLLSARAHKTTDVVTDDGDFLTCLGIRVFTANRSALAEAAAAGKLVTR